MLGYRIDGLQHIFLNFPVAVKDPFPLLNSAITGGFKFRHHEIIVSPFRTNPIGATAFGLCFRCGRSGTRSVDQDPLRTSKYYPQIWRTLSGRLHTLKLSPHIPRIRIVVFGLIFLRAGAALRFFSCFAALRVTDLPSLSLPLGLCNIFTNSLLLQILRFKELAHSVATHKI